MRRDRDVDRDERPMTMAVFPRTVLWRAEDLQFYELPGEPEWPEPREVR
jgi:hypothetical protein